ncbi:hypothetical protein APHAL10511_003502 [Amanita phalloides]|nr:hypothetical protein APHAL10511_003502 [Amanita phalloides]
MVVSKPAKTAKYSYAERVLQALSQVRKKHRRRAIYLATLRAQVKRNAEDQGDKLGPKWSSWIAKAVHRLEDEGILAANSSGSIMMTPNGKKAIVAARKSLPIPRTSVANAAREDMIWKTVSHVSSTPQSRGVKRPRYSTVQPSREYEHQNEDDLQSSPTSHLSVRAKRARYSASTGKKPMSQMTKSELKAALKSLETEHTNLLMRATSPLTDLDGEEERERLRSDLQARDEELERIRRQIDGMTASVGRHGSDIDQRSISVYRDASSSLTPEHRRPAGGVIRTLSGSLICDVSKQPTPAPSNTGEGWDSDTEPSTGDMEHMFGRFDDSGSINGAERGHPVAAVSKRIYDTHLGTEISRLKTLMEDTKKATDEREHMDSRKISELETTLVARVSEIEAQKEQHTNLSEQFAELEKKLGDRNFRISSLEREIEVLQASLFSESSQLVSKDTELGNVRISKNALEASLTTQLHQLERTVEEREEAIALLMAEKVNCLEQVDAVRRDLQQAEEALTMYSKRITLSVEDAAHLRAALQHAQLELEQNRDELKKLQQVFDEERRAHAADISERSERLARQEADLTSLTQRLEDSTSLRESLSGQRAAMETALDASQESIRALRSRISISEATLAERESKVAELTDTLSQARSEGCGLQEKVMSLELNVGNLRKELDVVNSNHAGLKVTYQLKCDECNDLLIRVQNAECNITELSKTLSKAKDDADSLRQHLEASESAWRDSLRRAEASHEEVVGSLSAEVKQLREKSSAMELEANSFKDKAAENQLEITKLQKQLSVAQRDLQRAMEVRIAAEAQFSSERATYESKTSAMDESLKGMQREVDDLSSQLISAQITFRDIQEELNARTLELSDVRASLQSEGQRMVNLESKLTAAVTRASDAEEHLLDFKSSKQADEKTINMLKESFAKLRDVQMQSLTELGDKVHSAHANPVSKRRLTTSAA